MVNSMFRGTLVVAPLFAGKRDLAIYSRLFSTGIFGRMAWQTAQ
jgi:hypothetical protein